jgi:hypothetical protein
MTKIPEEGIIEMARGRRGATNAHQAAAGQVLWLRDDVEPLRSVVSDVGGFDSSWRGD